MESLLVLRDGAACAGMDGPRFAHAIGSDGAACAGMDGPRFAHAIGSDGELACTMRRVLLIWKKPCEAELGARRPALI